MTMVYDSPTQSPFLDIDHRLFTMSQDVSEAGSASGFSHFAVTSIGQDLLSGAISHKAH